MIPVVDIKDINFISFDIETTGLNPLEDDILELAAVRFTIKKGIIDVFSSLVFSDKVISDEVISIHGITNSMVKCSPKVDFILSEFNNFIKNDYLLAHNAPFDTCFIGYQLVKYNISPSSNFIYDTLRLSRLTFSDIRGYSLDNLKEALGINVDNSHRALDDSIATMKLFFNIIDRLGLSDISSLAHLYSPISFANYIEPLFSFNKDYIDKISFAKENNLTLVITYLDKYNNLTTREIDNPSMVFLYDNIYIDCHCLLRGEGRRLRLDRVKSISFKN